MRRALIDLLPDQRGRHGLRGLLHHGLPGGRQCGPALGIDQQLGLLGHLVMALQHAHLQHLGQTQRTVTGERAELGRLDLAPAQGRDDLVDGQLKDGRPQLLIDLRGQPPGMEAHAVQILHPRDGTLEPAKGRRGQRPVQQRMHLQAGRCIDLLQQRLTTAVPMPGQQRQRIHAERGPAAPEPD